MYFSLRRQRKVPKEKRTRRLTRYAGSLRFSRSPALAQLAFSLRSTRSDRAQASSGLHCDARLRQTGVKFKTNTQNRHPVPVCTHRVPQTIRDQGRSCLSVASSAHPLIGEERRASAPADECSGCPSLWVLSLGKTRESASADRAKSVAKKITHKKTTENGRRSARFHSPYQ
jgi:hypothetical protein